MKCPHCREGFHEEQTLRTLSLGNDSDGAWGMTRCRCPSCGRFIFNLERASQLAWAPGIKWASNGAKLSIVDQRIMVWPKASARPPCPKEVPPAIREDYSEACLVLADSPKASAALSRRCLQNVLVGAAKVKKRDLYDQIEEVLASNAVPSYVADGLHAVRVIGKIAAHGIKSERTGEILPVEPGEAEWNLDTLELVFDFYYVQPKRHQEKEEALNAKLKEAGKQPIPKRAPPTPTNEE